MNAWVWHKKKEPPFYRELRILEMFIAISETKFISHRRTCLLAGRGIKNQNCFLHYFRGLLSEFDLAQISVQRILPGRQFFESVLGQFLFAHAAVGTDVFAFAGYWSELNRLIHLLFRKPDRSQRPV